MSQNETLHDDSITQFFGIDFATTKIPLTGEGLTARINAIPSDPNTMDLAEVLRRDFPLRADAAYRYASPLNPALTVILSHKLVKFDGGAYNNQLRRLLTTISRGNGARNGIKRLDLGDDIVEVKAIMRGHFRLIGCLEGSTLRLLRLIDIKESRASYAKQIPGNLCPPIGLITNQGFTPLA